jgi:hypothetical protein
VSCGGTTGPQTASLDGSTFDVVAPRRENWCSLNAPDAAVCDDFDGYRTLEDVTLAGWTSKTTTPSSMLSRQLWDPVSPPTCLDILHVRPEDTSTPRPWAGLLTKVISAGATKLALELWMRASKPTLSTGVALISFVFSLGNGSSSRFSMTLYPNDVHGELDGVTQWTVGWDKLFGWKQVRMVATHPGEGMYQVVTSVGGMRVPNDAGIVFGARDFDRIEIGEVLPAVGGAAVSLDNVVLDID